VLFVNYCRDPVDKNSGYHVKDVMTVEPRENVKTAAEFMKKNEIGCLIVVENEKSIGIVTERYMLNRVLMSDKDLEENKVHDVMTRSLMCLFLSLSKVLRTLLILCSFLLHSAWRLFPCAYGLSLS